MKSARSIAACLLVFATAAMLTAVRADTANDQPPPVPYGTQQSMKLGALIEAAPFMAQTEDDVRTLMQQRLKVCAAIFQSHAERVDLGRMPVDGLTQSVEGVKEAWLALSDAPEARMPVLKFVLQLAEHREKSARALSDVGQIGSLDLLAAQRDRLTAEIELAQCQRALSNASVR